jgi:hypothetical protein
VKTAVVIASGPSLTQEQVDAALRSGHFTIAVNGAYKIAPTADVLYAGDMLFWKTQMAEIKRVFKGKLVTQDNGSAQRWGIQRVRGTNRDGFGKDVIHLGGNSGFQGVNLAYVWGYTRIILLGFDLRLGSKGERHFHADWPHPMVQNQVFEEWLKKWDRASRDIRAFGIEILNCTPGSALTCFPMPRWQDVLCKP